jgi:hypothetical protein
MVFQTSIDTVKSLKESLIIQAQTIIWQKKPQKAIMWEPFPLLILQRKDSGYLLKIAGMTRRFFTSKEYLWQKK